MSGGAGAGPAGGVPLREPSGLQRAGLATLVAFLVVFPKGGLKLGGAPITWGYLALAVVSAAFLFGFVSGRGGALSRKRLVVLTSLIPLQVIIAYTLLVNGTTDPGFAIALVVSFYFLPIAFLLVLGSALDSLDLSGLYRLLRTAIPAVAAYGIFLFFYRLATGEFIEVPFLTVNAGDAGGLENKFIDRGGIFKLISTYNNGNIYGVSILLLLPLFQWLEKRTWPVALVKLSLVLTLSRTVWAGLIVYEVLHRLYVRRPSLRTLVMLGGVLLAIGGALVAALGLLGAGLDFVFDANLGGRIGQFAALNRATLLPTRPFTAIVEMVYLSVLDSFGILGLAALLLVMLLPLGMHLAAALPFAHTSYKRALATSLLVYLFVAMADGAMLFIPVMAFYWFVVSLLVSGNPTFQAHADRVSPRAGAAAPLPRR